MADIAQRAKCSTEAGEGRLWLWEREHTISMIVIE